LIHGIITGLDERGAQKQVFGRVAANRQLGRQHQPHAVLVGRAGRLDDLLRIARHVSHAIVQLGNADFEWHVEVKPRKTREKRLKRLCHPRAGFAAEGQCGRVERPAGGAKPGRGRQPLHAPRIPGRPARKRQRHPETGWTPRFVTLWKGDTLAGACALYLKDHSYGEYVFDHAWANAYQQHGLEYYPKAVAAVPFTPVPGARLLARTAGRARAAGQGHRGLVRGRRALVPAPACLPPMKTWPPAKKPA
jgi:hypothetical protein